MSHDLPWVTLYRLRIVPPKKEFAVLDTSTSGVVRRLGELVCLKRHLFGSRWYAEQSLRQRCFFHVAAVPQFSSRPHCSRLRSHPPVRNCTSAQVSSSPLPER